MKLLPILLLLLVSDFTLSQGIYTDYGIARIYCFANNADIEIELEQQSPTVHSFNSMGGDIYNTNSEVQVESIPNGVSFYLSNENNSVLSVIILNDDNIKFEGLVALTGSSKEIDFDCEID